MEWICNSLDMLRIVIMSGFSMLSNRGSVTRFKGASDSSFIKSVGSFLPRMEEE